MNANKKVSIPAMNESWHDFPWEKFPGGVKVTFAMMPEGGRGVALLRPTRWAYELSQQELCPKDTLEHVLAVFNKQLKDMGVVYTLSTNKSAKVPAVIGWASEGGVFHLMMQVTYLQIGPSEKVEFVPANKAYQIESGLALSNPACKFLPALLGWESATVVEEKDAVAA